MRRIVPIVVTVAAACMLSACRRLPSVVGDWTEDDMQSKMFLELKEDKSFGMVAGNDFAAGVVWGKYEVSRDRITLHFDGGGGPYWTYRWVGPDEIVLTSDLEPGKEHHLKRVSRLTNMLGDTTSPAAMANASEQALATSCMANLKQMSTAALMYAQDYDGRFGDSDLFRDQLLPYLKNDKIFSCPALQKAGKEGGYAMNFSLSGADLKSISNPQTAPMFFEVPEGAPLSGDPVSATLRVSRHNGAIAFVYADGHAADGARK